MLQLFPPLFWAGVYERGASISELGNNWQSPEWHSRRQYEDEDRNVPAPYRCKPFDGLRAISIGRHDIAGASALVALLCVYFVLLVLSISVWLVVPCPFLDGPSSVPVPALVSMGMLERH